MWTSAKNWSRGRGVKSVRMIIYVARLLETSQEQFITDIRAILGSQNFIMTRKTLSTTGRVSFIDNGMVGPDVA